MAALRRLTVPALVLIGAVYVAWLGFGVQTTGDYPRLFAPAMGALLGGHVDAFFHLLPEDGAGGSVLLRAPGALLGRLLVGGRLAEFRFGALESILALGGLGMWLARELVVLLAAGLALPLARGSERTTEDCLALLALVFLARCLLDPDDHVYYHVPFVIALLAWEARTRDAPVLALLATGLLWLVFHTVSGVAGLDVQFIAYLAVTMPFVAVLLRPALGRAAPRRQGVPARPAAAH
ncbi:MAG TPA: hypothetical protein VIJ20_05945 [Solirubrobacteraceae bacterium]